MVEKLSEAAADNTYHRAGNAVRSRSAWADSRSGLADRARMGIRSCAVACYDDSFRTDAFHCNDGYALGIRSAALISISTAGYDFLLLPAMLCSNIAQGAVCFGAAFAAKDKKLRQVAFPAGTSALLAGVTEPALYGVTLKRRIYMAAAMIAGGIGGFILGIVGVRTYALASLCITSIIQFVAPDDRTNLLFACVSAAVSFVVAFVLSFIFTRTARNESLSEKTGE